MLGQRALDQSLPVPVGLQREDVPLGHAELPLDAPPEHPVHRSPALDGDRRDRRGQSLLHVPDQLDGHEPAPGRAAHDLPPEEARVEEAVVGVQVSIRRPSVFRSASSRKASSTPANSRAASTRVPLLAEVSIASRRAESDCGADEAAVGAVAHVALEADLRDVGALQDGGGTRGPQPASHAPANAPSALADGIC